MGCEAERVKHLDEMEPVSTSYTNPELRSLDPTLHYTLRSVQHARLRGIRGPSRRSHMRRRTNKQWSGAIQFHHALCSKARNGIAHTIPSDRLDPGENDSFFSVPWTLLIGATCPSPSLQLCQQLATAGTHRRKLSRDRHFRPRMYGYRGVYHWAVVDKD